MVESKALKVHRPLIRGNANVGHFVSDLIFVGREPAAVLEWEARPNGEEVPVVFVKLDPKRLHEFQFGEADYLYELPIEDPRPLH